MHPISLTRALAVGFVVLGVVGAAAVWVATDVVTRLGAATGVVSETSEMIEETIDTADAVIDSVSSGLDGADTIVADIAESTDRTAAVIDDASQLLVTDVADSVEAIEASLPALVGAGRVIDDTLSALSIFGVPYDSEVPFADALVDIDRSLDGLAEELRAQGGDLGAIAEPVRSAGVETARLATTLSDIQIALADARLQLADYRTSSTALSEVPGGAPVDPGLLTVLGRMFSLVWLFVGVLLGASAWRSSAIGGAPIGERSHA